MLQVHAAIAALVQFQSLHFILKKPDLAYMLLQMFISGVTPGSAPYIV